MEYNEDYLDSILERLKSINCEVRIIKNRVGGYFFSIFDTETGKYVDSFSTIHKVDIASKNMKQSREEEVQFSKDAEYLIYKGVSVIENKYFPDDKE